MPESGAPCSTATMPHGSFLQATIMTSALWDGITKPHDGLRSDDPSHIGSQVTSTLTTRHYDSWQCITGAYVALARTEISSSYSTRSSAHHIYQLVLFSIYIFDVISVQTDYVYLYTLSAVPLHFHRQQTFAGLPFS